MDNNQTPDQNNPFFSSGNTPFNSNQMQPTPPFFDNTNQPFQPNNKKSRKIFIISLLIILAISCGVIGIFLIKSNSSQQAEPEKNVAEQDEKEEQKEKPELDCTHTVADIQALTNEDNPNVYNLTTYLRTASRYLCVEEWGIALALPDDIPGVIYTPVDNGQADYSFSRVYIMAIIDDEDNIVWGNDYIPGSTPPILAAVERLGNSEKTKIDYVKQRYGYSDSNIALKTDDYTYYLVPGNGEELVNYYQLMYKDIEIPEKFYDDIRSVGNFVQDFDNYSVYDEDKS